MLLGPAIACGVAAVAAATAVGARRSFGVDGMARVDLDAVADELVKELEHSERNYTGRVLAKLPSATWDIMAFKGEIECHVHEYSALEVTVERGQWFFDIPFAQHRIILSTGDSHVLNANMPHREGMYGSDIVVVTGIFSPPLRANDTVSLPSSYCDPGGGATRSSRATTAVRHFRFYDQKE
eukprot:CAMPEP_0198327202 /NCGR_PEP_ID=MMETSP1450-20131203/14521_1 /TAXON_ID=753684 ORGANISM="Madagascaria erythrocladiodes, Strain CCMP3234" /NCGR_SAMPLE_ID=MMETSP1450 /ASSEMBLY_ACC=CAM_ASM_001115 /LENGTH=181 /DNA_ID=CAMNT_0044031233 /DNA_START=40 /DNA_END=585 /DNA_ORIENTATION=+